MKYNFEYDYSKLKGRIVEKYGSQNAFADAISRDACYVSRLMNCVTRFTPEIIEEWCVYLEIPREEISIYFFTLKVDECKP